jgi:hypothetical protein
MLKKAVPWLVPLSIFAIAVVYSVLNLKNWREREQGSPMGSTSAVTLDSSKTNSSPVIIKSEKKEKFAAKVTVNPFPGSVVKTEIVPATPLRNPTDKPDYVAPRHIRLSFVEGSASSSSAEAENQENGQRETFYPLEINVYPVAEYRKALSLSSDLVSYVDREFANLKKVIYQKKANSFKAMPFIPLHNGSQHFAVRKKYINFRGGQGFAFLTHLNINMVSLVTNRNLTYIYQGLTDDSRYYIFASFPVSVVGLPRDNEANVHDGFDVNKNFSVEEKAQRKYRAYLKRVSRRLDNISPYDFSPSLIQVERIIRSLGIENSPSIVKLAEKQN